MENKEKLFHFHLEDGCNNAKTLVCRLVNGSIKYSFYGGHGSSGTPFSLSNIQYYDIVNGNMRWKSNASLPVDTLEGETKEQFKQRVKDMLNNSTVSVVGEVSTNVTFA
tara:strand:+ start:28 stop:354 length:327 start_codon:yes stop_codon:yes gene_type:complete